MNLSKLFEAQKELDSHIEKEKGLQGQDLLDKKILALQVELGELAQNWRGFKFWSKDQEPRTETVCWNCEGTGGHMGYIKAPMIEYTLVACRDCDGTGIYKKPLLEEYVDCLHFILSIGNDLSVNNVEITCDYTGKTITKTFMMVHLHISDLVEGLYYSLEQNDEELRACYHGLTNIFIGLGYQFGFTWSEIEQAYYSKNKVNHERQEQGY